MVLIADTGPVLSFARAHCFALLREVVGTLVMPEAVYDEIVVQGVGKPGAEEVRGASWITRVRVTDRTFVDQLPQSLNRGEREALALARERGGTVLVDDRDARRVAVQQGIAALGSLRLLAEAKQRGVIPAVKPVLDALMATGTYISDTLYRSFLRDMGEEPPEERSEPR